MRKQPSYTYEQFRGFYPPEKRPSDVTIRRWIRDGKLPRSGNGIVYYADLPKLFGVNHRTLDDMIAAASDPATERLPA